ncbi:MAG: Asp-tRNA(Asn)/Glu-tRNA(Gln) amidotransferase subunit GatA [Actinobacteria bacterium]|uniref:glutaminyl-tRNA synthase (glutamine-hydrolyzing) n=1 Tax=freshwater metagenome TaxID=449393 RepID=A0A6J6RID3_9ZZZZ|nr:Asp-tRNA(Asn)/Glu-tRNA(Gln) amidotransferase subunit GatA [Actinomycetota bacterium]MSW22906.1 Asp-tRNA(Asn)/Glu-tRNA(Gln) amidotransferase subunit GatA [Actinomycetota bacterium]MSX04528.1 Asp-tRNA(Asn)/Glu-tRNA(Gln) amidotransferase subunit GatA [Actinomycetota bacterium]MSX61711.1 Asp-tRNA(Asn)/Glu-tRNA(Gln) amidotransferase subunit GatA [Actinomycetota bacterium]MSX84407.1 Asp-tRNA(Asn)/Glu-tRNA(Gln) amidotransferase subunit GatA [Actinomycetota bacterium]
MTNIYSTAAEMASALSKKEITSVELTKAHLDRIAEVDGKLHSFLHVDNEGALAQAAEVDAKRAMGKMSETLSPLAGVPIAVKDILAQKGIPTTAGSKILEGWRPPYDSTVVAKLKAAGVVILGKTNMDEFAMGSSTENSAYGTTQNPWDLTRTPGGSSGGSAAAVAGFEAPLAIGTDTGGSIRQPAALTGIVGVKPTYGGVSRYGVIAYSSSLDQVGPFGRTVLDTALLHEVIAGHDERDSTSINAPIPQVVAAAKRLDVKGMKIGVIKELSGSGFQAGVSARINESIELLVAAGAEIVEVSCPNFEYALAAYYLIAPSEASSNLARFDSMRYGLRVGDDGTKGAEEVMSATREAGFGKEVKRRIILGTYALSSGYYDAYYGSAQKVRTLVKRDFENAFTKADVLISPVTPTTAFKLGEKSNDPVAMYLSDIATIPVNMAGIGGMSLPVGLAEEDGLPVGLQIMAPLMQDDRFYRVGGTLEAALLSKWGKPILSNAPDLAVKK